jgi:hypothetical protein
LIIPQEPSENFPILQAERLELWKKRLLGKRVFHITQKLIIGEGISRIDLSRIKSGN